MTLDELLARFEKKHRSGNGWDVRCPAHDDKRPSLSIAEGDKGLVLTCRAGCPTEAVLAKVGLTTSDLFHDSEPRSNGSQSKKRIIETYPYLDETGELLFEVVRFEPKGFAQRRPDGRGGWAWNLNGTRRVLYRLDKVRQAIDRGEVVFLVEGERDVQTLERLGLTATCSPGGAGKWQSEFVAMLTGASSVVVLGDDDDAGRAHALTAADGIARAGISTTFAMIFPGGWTKRDVTEWAAPAQTAEMRKQAKRLLLETAERHPRFNPLIEDDESDVAAVGMFTVITARELCALPDPPATDHLLGDVLIRGSRTLLGGATGDGKTSWMLQAARTVTLGGSFLGWEHDGGESVLVVDCEMGTRSIKRQLRQNGLHESELVEYIRAPDGLTLDTNEAEVAALEQAIQAGGYSVVILDPLYKMHRGESNDERGAVDLMRILDGWRERYHFALLLGAHTRKPLPGSKSFTIHDLFGSSAYSRGAEVVLGIQRLRQGYSRLHFFKDRDGELEINSTWGLLFDREHGFRLDPNKGKPSNADRVRELREQDPAITQKQAAEVLDISERTVRSYWTAEDETEQLDIDAEAR